jgi:hypothetical protein
VAWAPARGETVVAGPFGKGIVQRVTRTAALILLENSGVKVELPLQEIAPLGSGAATPAKAERATVKLPEEGKPADSDTKVRKRRAIEALRFGLVPEDAIEELTLGYEELREWVLDRLPHVHGGSPQVSEICGPYGSGKSHTMAVIRYLARREGYVTARVEVDGLNVSLSDPERLLYALWGTLRANGLESSTPLLDLCVKAIDAGNPPPSVAPRGIDRVHDNYSTARLLKRSPEALDNHGHKLDAVMSSSDEFTASEVALEISREPSIHAFDVVVRRMIGQKVADRPYDFVETWIGYSLVARLAGYKGLCITIDEFEVERLLPRLRFDRVEKLLLVLQKYFAGDLDHPRAPLAVFFATVGQEGHDGDMVVDRLVEASGGGYYRLRAPSRVERIELARRIYVQYSEAYGVTESFSASVAESVENYLQERGAPDGGLIRAFIKTYVGALDSLHGPGPRWH